MDYVVQVVTKSQTRMSNFHFHHLKDGDKGFAREVLKPRMECNLGPEFGACF